MSGQYKIYNENVLTGLAKIETETVQCCVTSPPYWGLRAYGTDHQIWGGDKNCSHEWNSAPPRRRRSENDVVDQNSKQATSAGTQHNLDPTNICSLCGAWRGELGGEPTPELFVKNIVEIFRGVRRVMKKDGTLWLNIGDSYAGNNSVASNGGRAGYGTPREKVALRTGDGLKNKDLVGIPWMVAFALRADGWYLRSDIIWQKPNPMPESVTDRPTKSHEYIFLLTKSGKYYYDAEAIAEPLAQSSISRLSQDVGNQKGSDRVPGKTNGNMKAVMKNLQPDGQNPNTMHKRRAEGLSDKEYLSRNARDVWIIPTQPNKQAHFATFPDEIPLKCISAGSRKNDTVLDPFTGSGTTGEIALRMERKFVGIELNKKYVKELINPRLNNVMPLFAEVNV